MTDRSSEKRNEVSTPEESTGYRTPKLAVYGSLMELTLSGAGGPTEAFPQAPGKRIS
jgi:hypothetical protein